MNVRPQTLGCGRHVALRADAVSTKPYLAHGNLLCYVVLSRSYAPEALIIFDMYT